MKKTTLIILCALLLILPLKSSRALTAYEIVTKGNLASYYGGNDGVARATMTITDRQGRRRVREFTILRKDLKDGGRQNYYVYFHRPGDVRKTVFMVHKKVGADDDRWLYLPALDLVKRIAASDKRTSFVGSHFFYEDVSGRSILEDTHTLMEETATHYVLSNLPKNPGSVEFSRYTIWIDKKTFLPVKAEYYDRQGKLYRRVLALEVKEVEGIPTVMKSKVEDLISGGNTVMIFKDVKYNRGISEKIFTERYLRKPPRKYIRR